MEEKSEHLAAAPVERLAHLLHHFLGPGEGEGSRWLTLATLGEMGLEADGGLGVGRPDQPADLQPVMAYDLATPLTITQRSSSSGPAGHAHEPGVTVDEPLVDSSVSTQMPCSAAHRPMAMTSSAS